jgi:hypothetical protein
MSIEVVGRVGLYGNMRQDMMYCWMSTAGH